MSKTFQPTRLPLLEKVVEEKSNQILTQSAKARVALFKRWVAEPQITRFPKNIEFGEIHSSLDELEERIAELREEFSFDKFKKEDK